MKSKYTKEILEPIVRESKSYREVLIALGLKVAGGNHSHLKRIIDSLGLSTEHFYGSSWNVGRVFEKSRKSPDEYLRYYDRNKSVNTHKIKTLLIRDGIKKHICEECGLEIWNDEPIPIELHHINGDRWNNLLENLLILCPNCHAQASNNSGTKNKKKKEDKLKPVQIEKECTVCKNTFLVPKNRKNQKCCSYDCSSIARRSVERPAKKELSELIKNNTWTSIGKMFSVSDNAVRKWAKIYGLIK